MKCSACRSTVETPNEIARHNREVAHSGERCYNGWKSRAPFAGDDVVDDWCLRAEQNRVLAVFPSFTGRRVHQVAGK